jgi:hypothetical protein
MSVTEITARDRVKLGAARAETSADWWAGFYIAALHEVATPGESGEIASGDGVCLEWGARDRVSVFVADHEEAEELTPEQARGLAFRLLVIADMVELGKEESR